MWLIACKRNKIYHDDTTKCERSLHGPICCKDPAFCIKWHDANSTQVASYRCSFRATTKSTRKRQLKSKLVQQIEFLKRDLIQKKTDAKKEWEQETNSKMGDLNPLCQ